VDAGGKSLISICFSKIAGAPIGSLKFLGSKEESMACALRRYEVTDSGLSKRTFISAYFADFLFQDIPAPITIDQRMIALARFLAL
jgi:hypothetical protein